MKRTWRVRCEARFLGCVLLAMCLPAPGGRSSSLWTVALKRARVTAFKTEWYLSHRLWHHDCLDS